MQAVARLRKKGRILFTIPPVKYSIKDAPTLSFLKAIPVVDNIALKTETERFLKKEKSLLADIITEKKLGIKKEEQRYNQDINEEVKEIKRPDIQFPSDDTFILERGQEFLKGKS
ncbi:MAG: hypothetical protein IPL63_19760 [Saprospiraceae bacterium]|nr:hypothetical protein [Saprospiraceae bacterium]